MMIEKNDIPLPSPVAAKQHFKFPTKEAGIDLDDLNIVGIQQDQTEGVGGVSAIDIKYNFKSRENSFAIDPEDVKQAAVSGSNKEKEI